LCPRNRYASLDWPKEALEIIADVGGVTVDNFVELRTYGFDEAEPKTCFAGHVHPDRDFTHRYVYEQLGGEAMRAVHAAARRHWRRRRGQVAIEGTMDALLADDYFDAHMPIHNYEVDKGWLWAIDHFAECIATGAAPENSNATDGLIAEQLATAAAESRKSGQPVTLDE